MEGYEPWRAEGITVRKGECRVETRFLTASLTPTGS